MHDQMQVAPELDVQELAVPSGSGDGTAGNGARRWVERLQRAEGRYLEPVDGVPDRPLTQVGGECFDLRQLRHALTVTRPRTRHIRPALIMKLLRSRD
jgi:hypothetical protein